MTLVSWGPDDLAGRLDEILDVYAQAMGYSPDLVASRRGFVATHTRRAGFRAVATLDEAGRVLGFGYGYRGERGQWWHEQVAVGLHRNGGGPAAYQRWMGDSFELVELHVLPRAQGAGRGHAQLLALLDEVPSTTVLLSTPEGASRAWRLYRRTGFQDVLRHHLFPGDVRPFAVLGRDLPLGPSGG